MRARIIGKSSAARGRVTFPPFSCDPDIDEPTAAIGSIRLGGLPHTLPTRTLPGQQIMSSGRHAVPLNACTDPMQRRASSGVKNSSWTGDNLLRQVVYEGLREDKPAVEVRRPVPHPKSGARSRTVTAKKPVARSQGVLSKP